MNAAKVITHTRKPRQKVRDLKQIAQSMSPVALAVLGEIVNIFAGKHPRYPLDISVNIDSLQSDVLKVLSTAELVSDTGLGELIKKAQRLDDEYPRYPKTNAAIIPLACHGVTRNKQVTA